MSKKKKRRKKKKIEKVEPITKFTGRYRFLSNYYLVQVKSDGIWYPSVEHAYQAAKVRDHTTKILILNQVTPNDAKKFIRKNKITIRGDWEEIKMEVMYNLLLQKFGENTFLKEMLLKTNGAPLINGNFWGDNFWGVNEKTMRGENHLGKMLMEIRRRLGEMEE